MRRSSLLIPLLFVAAITSADDKFARAEEILKRAYELSNLHAAGVGPYELQADVKVTTGKRGVPGTYRLLWNGSQWREELNLPGYQEVRFGERGRYWRVRPPNVRYPPAHAAFAAARLGPLLLRTGTKVLKIVERKQDSVRVTCIALEGGTEFCVDTARGVLVSGRSRSWVEAFSDFRDFRGKIVPRSMGRRDFINTTEFHVTKLLPLQDADPKLFVPSADAEEWETCENPQPPKPLSTPPPMIRHAFGKGDLNLHAVFLLVITKTGDVEDLTLARSAQPLVDKDIIEVLSKWRYRPAMCGDRSIPTEVEVDIDSYQYVF